MPSGASRLAARLPHRSLPRLPGVRVPEAYDLISRLSPVTRRQAIVALAATAVVLMAHLYIFAPRGLVARNKLHDMIETKREELAAAQAANRALATEIVALRDDTETIESIARNELSMARPQETIYRARRDTVPAYVLSMMPR